MRAREYLTAAELTERTPWSTEAVKAMVRRGVLVRGRHYFQPGGSRHQLLFKWSAVVELIEGSSSGSGEMVEKSTPRRGPGRIDVEKATERARRLLG